MRSFKSLSVLGFVLLACMSLMVIGCGSDDPPTTSNQGSLTDPNFIAVQSQIDVAIDSTVSTVLSGMTSAYSVATDGTIDVLNYSPAFSTGDIISKTYINGWHVLDLNLSNANFVFSVLDSVQFYNNDEISQQGIGADSIWYRHRWSFQPEDTNASYTEVEAVTGYDFRGLDGGVAIVDGSSDLVIDNQVVDGNSTYFRHFEFVTTVDDLHINKTGSGWVQACPNSGSMTTSISMLYSEDNADPITTEWDVAVTFNEGVATVSVSSGGLVWNYETDVCTAI